MNNFINNCLQSQLPINFSDSYQIVMKYGLIKYGLPKSAILLILLFL